MADSAGNDITLVGVAVTGKIAIAPYGTTIPSASGGAADPLTLDAAFGSIGLVKKDGGPQLAWAASGDPIDFWQDGYEIPSGLADVTLVVTAAEILGAQVRAIIAGDDPDVNGYLTVDGGGHSTQYVLFTEEIFKSGAIRRRVMPNATLQSVAEDKNGRGEVIGQALTFKIARHASVGGMHWGEWVLPAA